MQSRFWRLRYQLPVNQFEVLPFEEARRFQGTAIGSCEPDADTGWKLCGMTFDNGRHNFLYLLYAARSRSATKTPSTLSRFAARQMTSPSLANSGVRTLSRQAGD